MKNKSPKISVIMSVYNDSFRVQKSIESILNQKFDNFEFLILDDGSTDNTFQVLSGYKKNDTRVKIFKNKKNFGLTKSLNMLFQCLYFLVMDQDHNRGM